MNKVLVIRTVIVDRTIITLLRKPKKLPLFYERCYLGSLRINLKKVIYLLIFFSKLGAKKKIQKSNNGRLFIVVIPESFVQAILTYFCEIEPFKPK